MAQSGFESADKNDSCNKQNSDTSWHPDLSRERPEWKAAHAGQKDARLDVSADGVYTVKNGDTLYDIASRSLKAQNGSTDGNNVKQEMDRIVQASADVNSKLCSNPDLLHAGDRLKVGVAQAPSDQSQVCTTNDQPAVVQPPIRSNDYLAPQDGRQPINNDSSNYYQQQPDAGQVQRYDDYRNQYTVPQDRGSYQFQQPQPLYQQGDSGYQYQTATPGYQPDSNYRFQQPGYQGDYRQPAYQGDYRQPGYVGDYNQPGYRGDYTGGNYIDQEATRLSQLMANNPHAAASEMRDQLSRLDAQSASALIAQTKNYEYVGGLGDLQIQREFDSYGRDTGFRNVTMATPDGIEQIAEIQSRPQPGYGNDGYTPGYGANLNPLAFAAGVIVGDLLFQRNRGLNFNDEQYRGWCNREQNRETYWNNNNSAFTQNWRNPQYRQQYQNQNWQQVANNPTVNNTYITNNRYDTTINNRTVNHTTINETINNTQINNNRTRENPQPVTTPLHRVPNLPPVETNPGHNRPNPPENNQPGHRPPNWNNPGNQNPPVETNPGHPVRPRPPYTNPGTNPGDTNPVRPRPPYTNPGNTTPIETNPGHPVRPRPPVITNPTNPTPPVETNPNPGHGRGPRQGNPGFPLNDAVPLTPGIGHQRNQTNDGGALQQQQQQAAQRAAQERAALQQQQQQAAQQRQQHELQVQQQQQQELQQRQQQAQQRQQQALQQRQQQEMQQRQQQEAQQRQQLQQQQAQQRQQQEMQQRQQQQQQAAQQRQQQEQQQRQQQQQFQQPPHHH